MSIISETQKKLQTNFVEIFGGDGALARLFHAPGRVNIIGEHIDYNGGYVLPCALDVGTYALVRQSSGGLMRFASLDFEGIAEVALDNVRYDAKYNWANYPLGVVHQMLQDPQGGKLTGFDVLFSGNIPQGAGLSSSASIEVVTATALNAIFGLGYEMMELAQLAQRAENQFCGVNCGIMDQFAVAMAKKDMAIYLNCDTLEHRHVPLELGDYGIVIMDTNKRRRLNESKYNERRAECEAALADMQTAPAPAHKISHLAHITPDDFGDGRWISCETNRKRARHVVSENHRVGLAVAALEARDLATLGDLLYRSHVSLRDDYEVSCTELDAIVEAAMAHPACIGARMTGAGFGGCAIALVRLDAVQDFMKQVAARYEGKIGYAPAMYVQASGDGAREIT